MPSTAAAADCTYLEQDSACTVYTYYDFHLFNSYRLNKVMYQGVEGIGDGGVVDGDGCRPGLFGSVKGQQWNDQSLCTGTVDVDFDVRKSSIS